MCQSPSEDDHGCRGFDQSLKVFGEPAVAAESAEDVFDHPAFGMTSKPSAWGGRLTISNLSLAPAAWSAAMRPW